MRRTSSSSSSRPGMRNRVWRWLEPLDETLGRLDCLLECRDGAVHLLLVDRFQNLADARTRFEAEFQQMPAEQDWTGWFVLDAELTRALEEPIHRGAVERARLPSKAVRLRDTREKF